MSDNRKLDAKPILGTDKCWAGWTDFYIITWPSLKKRSDILMAVLHFVLIKFNFRCIGLGDDKIFSKDEVGFTNLPEDWNLLPKYALRYVFHQRLYLLFGYQVGKLLVVNLLSVATMNCSTIAFNTEKVVTSTKCGKLFNLVPKADEIAGRFFSEVIHTVAYPLIDDQLTGCEMPSLYPRTDDETDPWLDMQSSYEYIEEEDDEEDQYADDEDDDHLMVYSSKANDEDEEESNDELKKPSPILSSNSRFKTMYVHMATSSDFSLRLSDKQRQTVDSFEGWANLYLDIWTTLKRKSDIIIALYHFVMTKHGFGCIGLGDDKTYSENELGFKSLPPGWNLNPKYAIRYVHHKTLYILLGYQVESCLIINLLNMCSKKVSNIALYPDDLVHANKGDRIHNLVPKASYLAELFTDTIQKRIDEDTCEMLPELNDSTCIVTLPGEDEICELLPSLEESSGVPAKLEDSCELSPELEEALAVPLLSEVLPRPKKSFLPSAPFPYKDTFAIECSLSDDSIYSLKPAPESQPTSKLEVVPPCSSSVESIETLIVPTDQTRKRGGALGGAGSVTVNVSHPALALSRDRRPNRKKPNPASATPKMPPNVKGTSVVSLTEQNAAAVAKPSKTEYLQQPISKLEADDGKVKQNVYLLQWSEVVANSTFRRTDGTDQPESSQDAAKRRPTARVAHPKQESTKEKSSKKSKRKVKYASSPTKEKDEPKRVSAVAKEKYESKRVGAAAKEKYESKRVARPKPSRHRRKKHGEHKAVEPVSEAVVAKALQKLLRRRAKLELDVQRLSTGKTMSLEQQRDQLQMAVNRMNADNQLILQEQRAKLERAIETLRSHNHFLNTERYKKEEFDLESLNSSGRSEQSSEADSDHEADYMRRRYGGFDPTAVLSERERNLTLSAKFVRTTSNPKKKVKGKINLRPRNPRIFMSSSISRDRRTQRRSSSPDYLTPLTRPSASLSTDTKRASAQLPQSLAPNGPLHPKESASTFAEDEPMRRKIKFASATSETLTGYTSYLQSKTSLSEATESIGSPDNAFSVELAALRNLLTPSSQKPDYGSFVEPIDAIPWADSALAEADLRFSIRSARYVEEEINPEPELVSDPKNRVEVESGTAPTSPPPGMSTRAADTSPDNATPEPPEAAQSPHKAAPPAQKAAPSPHKIAPSLHKVAPALHKVPPALHKATPSPLEMVRRSAGMSPSSATIMRLATALPHHKMPPPLEMRRRTAYLSATCVPAPRPTSSAKTLPGGIWETDYSARTRKQSLTMDLFSRRHLRRLECTDRSFASGLPVHAWADPEFTKIVAASKDALMQSNFNARRRTGRIE